MADRRNNSKGIKKRNDRNVLTFYEKLAVIRYHDEQNMSRNSLARMFQCCSTQIRRILEKRDELLQHFATLSEADASIIIEEMTRKRRKFEMSAISFILHQWVERCRYLGLRKSITNDTLKETAAKMAAILNLPTFRPTYRWLNRFRSKYKYDDVDLGTMCEGNETITIDLAVEDIIIEFKSYLPSFMQKEISAITSSTRETIIIPTTSTPPPPPLPPPIIEDFHQNHSEDDFCTPSPRWCSTPSITDDDLTAAGSTGLLNDSNSFDSVLYHLASIQAFGVLNSDFRIMELVTQLNDHITSMAAAGAYSVGQPSEAYPMEIIIPQSDDVDDIVLIE